MELFFYFLARLLVLTIFYWKSYYVMFISSILCERIFYSESFLCVETLSSKARLTEYASLSRE